MDSSCLLSTGDASVEARLMGRLVDFLLPLSRLSLSEASSLINGEGFGSRKNKERRKASGCCCVNDCAAFLRRVDPDDAGLDLILDLYVGYPKTDVNVYSVR